MKKKIASIIILMCMIINMLPALAEELANVDVIDTSSFTADNVIYETLQSTDGVSLFSDTPRSVNSDFDVVLGFDMSVDMYGFDYNGEMAWLDAFRALSEQVPDGTRFAVVTDSAANLGEGLESGISRVENIGYQGSSNIASLLDNCLDTFGEDSSDKNKVVIAVTANVDDTYALQNSIENLLSHGIIPFIFVLNSEDNNLDGIDYVYHCTNELELRLDMSDVFLSFAEFNTVQTASLRSAMMATTMSESSEMPTAEDMYNSDFRERHIFYGASDKGSALVSVLNAYSVLPVIATYKSSYYNLTMVEFSDANGNETGIDAETLISFLKGNSSVLDEGTNLTGFRNMWAGVYDSRKTDTNIAVTVLNNIKRNFPVVAEVNNEVCIISSISDDGDYISIIGEDELLSTDTITSVFDTYGYFREMALDSRKVQSNVLQSGTIFDLTKIYPVNYSSNDSTVLYDDLSVNYNYSSNQLHLTVDLLTLDDANNKIVVCADLKLSDDGIPEIYDSTPFYTIRLYKDVESSSEWYYKYLLKATNLGIVNGDDQGNFNDDNDVTRCEFIKMVLEAAQIETFPVDDNSHWNTGDWADKYMNRAYQLDILYDAEDVAGAAVLEYYNAPIPRYEAAYILKTLFMDKRESVQVPTLLYEYSDNLNSIKKRDWDQNKSSQTTSYNTAVRDAVYQMFMNDVFVGDVDGDLMLECTIQRSAAVKVVIKPLFELDDDVPQILANVINEGTESNIVNLNLDTSGVDLQDIVFDGKNERLYTITIANGDTNRYYAGTYGGLHNGDIVTLEITTTSDNQQCEEYNNEFEGHTAYCISGSGVYNVKITRSNAISNVGFKVKGINVAQNLYFNQQTYDKNGNPNYFIFVDSPESLKRKDVLYDGDKTKTLSCFTDLTPGTYTVFCYHHKARPQTDDNGNVIDPDVPSYLGANDSLYFNAAFYGYTGSESVKINKIGLTCYGDDSWTTFYMSWQEFLSSNIQEDIHGELKNGDNIFWLSELDSVSDSILISGNNNMGFMYLTMEFEITDGTINFATMGMANRTDFQNVFDPNQAKPTFDESTGMVKGLGEFGQSIESDILEYYIDDDVPNDTKLSFVMDSVVPNEGAKLTSFITNSSPLHFHARFSFPRSASLGLMYDTYYTSAEGEEEFRTLYFDTYHSPKTSPYLIPEIVKVGPYEHKDTWSTNEQFDEAWFNALAQTYYNSYDYSDPERQAKADVFEKFLGTTNMQGYGVTFKYNIVIHNLGDTPRKFVYNTWFNKRYHITCTGEELEENTYNSDGVYNGDLYEVDLPANSITTITIASTELAGAKATNENTFIIR